MVRPFWVTKIHEKWQEKSVVWLTGVRRSGKTTLCQSLTPKAYYDCELPRIRQALEDPEAFFKDQTEAAITLDEIHRLVNAAEVLKIAADHFPKLRVIATGSSTLAAGKKFKDSLTDRKRTLFLPPIPCFELKVFNQSLEDRLLRGGLPPFLLAKAFPESGYQDWIDSYWAKDVQELFRIEKRAAFLKFVELLALQSGGMFQANSFSTPCGVSHTTIATYLDALEQTHVAGVLRPYAKNPSKEIVSTPKVFFFDTGFVNFFQGVDQLHPTQKGHLWEHLVYNELLTMVEKSEIHYWRDKSKNEVDFVVKRRGVHPLAIECKSKFKDFDPHAIQKFRTQHPEGKNLVVTMDLSTRVRKSFDTCEVTGISIAGLRAALA